jgi:ribulose-phosphate 3-epimerase
MDGVFVPNLMLGTDAIRQLRRMSSIPLDIHLMIEKPEDKLEWFDIQPGELVSVHVESTRHLQRALAKIRGLGARPMAALNPATPLCMVEDVMADVDGILVMTVNPGFAGQKLVPQMLDKIARLRAMLDAAGRKEVLIEVDGNVSFENAKLMSAAGADIFVAGTSSIYAKGGDMFANAEKLRDVINNA